ncbi:hypothetical protein PCANC_02006 [Puccinia coronata f. sp. avenae]|uniref:Uncharacterized protein n=1 Tax=Puccinia coronata f. sp. avenae TaxID=200324 RepID=A0A2N5W1W5_9BASI|nr:hypothetical protein PCANC_07663 [Puccinia coronata f. sp. avenae]PLW56205.1 hypothetical protein PCANC_02006 [Puccinia coronata f. sp. avenae]
MAIGPGVQRAARLLAGAGQRAARWAPRGHPCPGSPVLLGPQVTCGPLLAPAATVLPSDSSPQLGTLITNHKLCNGQDWVLP